MSGPMKTRVNPPAVTRFKQAGILHSQFFRRVEAGIAAAAVPEELPSRLQEVSRGFQQVMTININNNIKKISVTS